MEIRNQGVYLFVFLTVLVLQAPSSISQEAIPTYSPPGPSVEQPNEPRTEIPKTLPPVEAPKVNYERAVFGVASWYSESDPYINLHTANGEIFDDTQLTCASWNYPFGTRLMVTNLRNNKSVICRVNDRGPAKRLNRLVDLTKGAFQNIANLHLGLIDVRVTPLKTDSFFNGTDR